MTDESAPLRVEHSELDYDRELIFTYHGKLFTGIAYEDVPGHWLSEVSYRDGMQDGPAREWYPSGVLKGESHHYENTHHGTSRDFDQSGQMRSAVRYEYGIVVSRTKFDESGRIIETFELAPDHQLYPLLQRYRQSRNWPAADLISLRSPRSAAGTGLR